MKWWHFPTNYFTLQDGYITSKHQVLPGDVMVTIMPSCKYINTG